MKAKLTLLFTVIIGMMLLLGPTSKATTEERVIEDGTYIISSTVNDNFVITVKDASQDQFANVEISSKTNLQHQKFNITYLQNGYYKIQALHSGKVLDVYAAEKNNGANINQYDWNSSKAQRWKILQDENGYVSFVSECNGLYIDIYAGLAQDGNNIQMYEGNESKAQKFKLQKIDTYIGKKTIEDGLYTISMSKNEHKAIGTQVKIWDYNKNVTQKFHITYLDNGYYQIKSAHSEKVLDVYAAMKYDGAEVNLYEWNNSDAQKWMIKANDDGTYSIISKCNNLNLDVYGGFTANGSKVHMYSDNGSAAQKFIIKEVEKIEPTKSIKNGIYTIKTSYDNAKVLEIRNSEHHNFSNVQIGTNEKTQNQKFRIEEIENTGYYKIIAIDSGKVLDVYAGAYENSTNVDQYEWNNSDAQKWIIKENTDRTYTIFSKCNELAVDVLGGSSIDGTNVQMYMPNNSKAQKFIFEEVQIINDGEYELETILKANQVIDMWGGSMQNAAPAQIWEVNNREEQKFIFKEENGIYTITTKHSDKVLTVGNQGMVYQYDYTGELGQQWQIEEAGNGSYFITSKLNNLYLTIKDNNPQNGVSIIGTAKNATDAQRFKITNEIRNFFEEGIYGKSGLAIKGDSRGTDLKYYKFGKGPNVLFATYSIHGFEDNYDHDGTELTYIAEKFKNYLLELNDASIFFEWQIYLFPTVNPDGQTYGTTNDGPGRTTIVSAAPKGKGIDINRNWQIDGVEYVRYKDARNYNGTAGFQAYETIALRDFLLQHKSTNGQTILVDLHGWLEETMGDNELGEYYRNEYGLTKHIETYGRGYLINWARSTLGVSKTARSVLVELPPVYSHQELVEKQLAEKYINATIKMLGDVSAEQQMTYSLRKLSATKNVIDENTEYEVALAGTIKNEMPENDEVQELIKQIPSETGIYITNQSRQKFEEILEKSNIKAFSINEKGYLTRNGENIENELEQQLYEKTIDGRKYTINISDICYIKDEMTRKIVEYPFVELDSLQICEPIIEDDNILLVINSNKENKIQEKEIIKTILQY